MVTLGWQLVRNSAARERLLPAGKRPLPQWRRLATGAAQNLGASRARRHRQ